MFIYVHNKRMLLYSLARERELLRALPLLTSARVTRRLVGLSLTAEGSIPMKCDGGYYV